MTEPEKMLIVPKKRYESYRFLALAFGLYVTGHFAIIAVREGGDWIDWTFIAGNALLMLATLRDAYDDRRRRKAAGRSVQDGDRIPEAGA